MPFFSEKLIPRSYLFREMQKAVGREETEILLTRLFVPALPITAILKITWIPCNCAKQKQLSESSTKLQTQRISSSNRFQQLEACAYRLITDIYG
jgi:hypothetical protein